MNSLILIGRLTRDPELRSTQSGKKVTYINVAVSRPFKNANGDYDTDFINVTLYQFQAENASVYCHKGDLVAIKGRIQTGSYTDKEGNKKYTMDIIADRITFLNSKSKEHNVENDIETTKQEDPYASMGDEVRLDDSDLPFDFDN